MNSLYPFTPPSGSHALPWEPFGGQTRQFLLQVCAIHSMPEHGNQGGWGANGYN